MYGDPGFASYAQRLEQSFGRYGVFFLVFFVTWIETLLFQSLPGLVCQLYVSSAAVRRAAMVVPFGLAHLDPATIAGSLLNGFVGGAIFAHAYLRYMQQSHYRAMLLTWLLHATSNAIALSLN